MAWIIAAAGALLAAFLAVAAIVARRGLIGLRHDALDAWAALDERLGKRQDHLSRVLELCGRLMHDEADAIRRAGPAGEAVTAAAARQDAAAVAAALQSHRALIRDLLTVAANYPPLASSVAFAALCARADELDARVDAARERYNAAASVLNLRRGAFPHSVLARATGLRAAPILP